MKTFLRLWFIFIVLAGLSYLLIGFWQSNVDQLVTPTFLFPGFEGVGYKTAAQWPLALALLVAFFVGCFATLLAATMAGLGFALRSRKFRQEIRKLKKEVEALRVADLDEESDRDLAFGGLDDEEMEDANGGESPVLLRSPPVSSGAVSSFDDDDDDDDDDGLDDDDHLGRADQK